MRVVIIRDPSELGKFPLNPIEVFQVTMGLLAVGVALGITLTEEAPSARMLAAYNAKIFWIILMWAVGMTQVTTVIIRRFRSMAASLAGFVWGTIVILFVCAFQWPPILFVSLVAAFANAYISWMYEANKDGMVGKNT